MNDRAVFLDRDGTLIEDRHYVGRLEDVVMIPGVPRALARLGAAGFRLVVVTNQSGVARGYFEMRDVEAIHAFLTETFARDGITIVDWLVCPCHPDDGCDCRKPSPKLVLDAANEYGLDLARSYFVGDSPADIGCGRAAGTKTVLVRTGKGRETERDPSVLPDIVADDLGDAVDRILEGCSELAPEEPS